MPALGQDENDSTQSVYDLDQQEFANALVASDPAQRFNPFTGFVYDPSNAALIPFLAIDRTSDTTSDAANFNFQANGQLAKIWGGPMLLSLGGKR